MFTFLKQWRCLLFKNFFKKCICSALHTSPKFVVFLLCCSSLNRCHQGWIVHSDCLFFFIVIIIFQVEFFLIYLRPHPNSSLGSLRDIWFFHFQGGQFDGQCTLDIWWGGHWVVWLFCSLHLGTCNGSDHRRATAPSALFFLHSSTALISANTCPDLSQGRVLSSDWLSNVPVI